jgi:Zn-dependent M16 (insulinase) family peptidase
LLEKQKIELDNAHTRSIVFDGLDMANKEISRISKNMDEEKQSEILDTMEEIRANNEEINDRMEAMVGGDLAEDEELEQQLADLMMENNKQVQSNLQPASVLNFPSLPNSQVNQAPARPSRVNDEEEALRALAAEMS